MENATQATARAQKKANATGITQYVGERYDCKLYVSKVKPTPDWLIETCEPAPDPAKVHAFVPGRESGIAEGARMCAVCDYLPGVGRHD